jgi:hypothetical protein
MRLLCYKFPFSLLCVTQASSNRILFALLYKRESSVSSSVILVFQMPNPPSYGAGPSSVIPFASKKREIVLFSSTAIALYGYDQGKRSYLSSSNSC